MTQTLPPELYFNGINGTTGEYLTSLTIERVVQLAAQTRPTAPHRTELEKRAKRDSDTRVRARPHINRAYSHHAVKQLCRNLFGTKQVGALVARSLCPPSIPPACRAMSISNPGDDLPPSSR
jgi:hypothetical protein